LTVISDWSQDIKQYHILKGGVTLKKTALFFVCVFLLFNVGVASAEYGTMTSAKETALKWLDDHTELGKEVSTYIWYHPELGMDEQYSSAILQEMLQKAGFTVETNIASMPTGFIATWGRRILRNYTRIWHSGIV
jgi:aminobenzoyl-glutamate utilization protein B